MDGTVVYLRGGEYVSEVRSVAAPHHRRFALLFLCGAAAVGRALVRWGHREVDDTCGVAQLRAPGGGTWSLGGGPEDRPVVEGQPADLALWLSGRSDGAALAGPAPLPALPAWL